MMAKGLKTGGRVARSDGITAQRVRLSAEVIALVLDVLGPEASPAEVGEFIRAAVSEKLATVRFKLCIRCSVEIPYDGQYCDSCAADLAFQAVPV